MSPRPPRLDRFFLFCFLLSVLSLLASAPAAYAACSNPAGQAGDMSYNGGFSVWQYCNGGAWVSIGPTGNTTTGLVGWWKLDDGAGTSAADSSGSGNTGTNQNTPVWTTGINNGALTFNGATQYVTMGDINAMDGLTRITVSAWVTFPITANNEYHIIDKSHCDGALNGGPFELFTTGNPETAQFAIYPVGGSPANLETVAGTTNIMDGGWHFVVGRYDGSAVSIWVDGAQENSNTIGAVTMSSNANAVEIGGHCNGAGIYWPGSIDDVRVYNRALSAADIKTLYTSIGGASGDINTGLIHQWRLDELAGAKAVDTPGGANVTLAGTAAFTASGKINGGLSLPNDATQKPSTVATPADILGKSALTMSMWFKRAAVNSVIQLGQEDPDGVGDEISIEAANNGNVYFSLSPNASFQRCGVTSSNDTNWHLATLVFDGSQTGDANRLKGYIDGRQQDLPSNCDAVAVPATTTSTARGFYIGDLAVGLANAGSMDDVRVYSRALSASDVLTLYNSTATACASPVGYAGDLQYNNGANHVMQFCNGSAWQPMGPVPGSGGAGCSSPAGSEGDMRYNSDYHTAQYCDGTNWIAAGGGAGMNGLVGWWNLDDGSSGTTPTTAADSSGNGHTGTLTNGPTWVAGKIGNALTFNGTSQYVSASDSLGSGDITISAWLYPTGNGDGFDTFLSEGTPGITIFDCVRDHATGDTVVCGDNSLSTYLTGATAIPLNQWTHVAIVRTSGGLFTSYINGVPDGAANQNGGATSSTGTKIFIGSALGVVDYFPGTIDDARVYNRALSAAEIWNLYNGSP